MPFLTMFFLTPNTLANNKRGNQNFYSVFVYLSFGFLILSIANFLRFLMPLAIQDSHRFSLLYYSKLTWPMKYFLRTCKIMLTYR